MVIENVPKLDANIRSTIICHRMSQSQVIGVNGKTGEIATNLTATNCRRDCAMYVKEIEECSDKIVGLLALRQLQALDKAKVNGSIIS